MSNLSSQPHSKESESCLLASMIMNNQFIPVITAKLPEDAFYLEPNRAIYNSVKSCYEKYKNVDLVLLRDEIGDKINEVGGVGYLASLVEEAPQISMYDSYLSSVLDKYRLRESIKISERIIREANNGADVEKIYGLADAIKARVRSENVKDIERCIDDGISGLDSIRKLGVEFSTGFREIDDCTGGVRRGLLYTVGGKTSQGKTSFAMNVALHNLKKNDKCKILYNGFENLDQVPTRLASIESRMRLDWFLKPNTISEEEYGRVVESMKALKPYKDRMLITNSASILQMKAICDEYKPDIIFLDYLQRYAHKYPSASSGHLSHEIGKAVSDLQDLALESRAAVFNFSQFSRRGEEYKGRKPQVEDLKESGDIENYSDVIFLLWWQWRDTLDPKKNPSDYQIIVAKNKLGPCKEFHLHVDVETLKLSDWGGNAGK